MENDRGVRNRKIDICELKELEVKRMKKGKRKKEGAQEGKL